MGWKSLTIFGSHRGAQSQALALLLSLLASTANATSGCEQIFASERRGLSEDQAVERLRAALNSPARGLEPALAFQKYLETFFQDVPGRESWRTILPADVLLPLLADSNTVLHARNFLEVLQIAIQNERRGLNKTLWDALEKNLLTLNVSPQDTRQRLRALELEISQGHVTPESVRQALGEMTLEQIQARVFGADPLAPSPESLLGEFIEKTGTNAVVRRFPKSPGLANNGARRLLVPVSPETFPLWVKMFSSENFLFHMHRPFQGTLEIAHQGLMGTYAGLRNTLRFPGPENVFGVAAIGPDNALLAPMILLSSTEGKRAADFFEIARERDEWARHPWELIDKNGQPYAAQGGYDCCTHWFGNIPVGDRTVESYSFPGNKEARGAEKGTRTKILTPYDRASYLEGKKLPPRVHQVWKVPGHEQLADVLGLGTQNLRAEFANPGWVFLSLAGRASLGRVPVVFVFVSDHRSEINTNSKLPVSAH